MCTAINIKNKDNYVGRNLDLDIDQRQEFIITPRNFHINLRKEKPIKSHYAIYGMGIVVDDFPLYFDAANEEGLAMLGLRYNEEVKLHKLEHDKINLCEFELIPYILGNAKNVKEARRILERVNVVNISFNKKISSSNLHYMISDRKECIVIESQIDGLKIFDNPIGVLTNSPNFPYHLENIKNYLNVTSGYVLPRFSSSLKLSFMSTGAGTYGLPGDLSSPSRFVRATFNKLNLIVGNDERSSVNGFFKVLDSVSFIKGTVLCLSNSYEYTMYSSCINLDKNIYYYKTYLNPNISAFELRKYDIQDDKLLEISLNYKQDIHVHP